MKDLYVQDPDFPVALYLCTKEDLINRLETDKSLPEWWKEKYKKLLLEEGGS